MPITLLLASLARVEALEARVAELTRPKAPEDFGLVAPRLTATERRIVMALLPPGEVLHRDVLIARAWPDIAAAGLAGESHHTLSVHMARVRVALRPSGWRVPAASTRSEYVLLRPGEAPPAGYRECRAADGAGIRAVNRRLPCPDCDGLRSHNSRRCRPCDLRARAGRAHGGQDRCPGCGLLKTYGARLCGACDLARRRGLLKGWAAA